MTTFDDTMTCEILTSDGNWTIGSVDGYAAEWEGNMTGLHVGDEFSFAGPGSHWGVQTQDDYIVDADGQWESQN